jgi:hypothetical protein
MNSSAAVQTCAESLHRVWPAIEAALLSVTRFPSFSRFLSEYRGLARAESPSDAELVGPTPEEQAEAQESIGEALFGALREAYSLASSPETSTFESVVNLALFLWSGPGDRNFQYRTVVHFCALDGLGDEVESGIVLSFCESGVRLGPPGNEHFPTRLPLSAVIVDDSLLRDDSRILARLRSLQRETCLLVDEWEHENALLAVEHTRIRQSLAGASPARLEQALREIVGRMGRLRDALSVWALRSFTDLQSFVSRVEAANGNADVLAECDAAQALLLSGLQKIHLPASVSRHRYGSATFRELLRWCKVRLTTKPEDAATRVLYVALELGNELENESEYSPDNGLAAEASDEDNVHQAKKNIWHELEVVFGSRTYEWSLDYDPSSGLKACCWLLPRQHHLFLCAFVTVLISRKLTPAKPGAEWLSILASLVQMPETFPSSPLSTTELLAPRVSPPHPAFQEMVAREALASLAAQPPMEAKGGVEADCVAYLVQALCELVPGATPKDFVPFKEKIL